MIHVMAMTTLQMRADDHESQDALRNYVTAHYDGIEMAPCPFVPEEIAELEETNELLVYVPARLKASEMCRMWGIESNVDFDRDKLVRTAMISESHWFITSASATPEHMYKSAVVAKRSYEDDGLHGLDVRRYLAFAATYRWKFGTLPDKMYWTFLLSGSYDRSGVSVVGFDAYGVLSHHGWMKNFKSKFTGSRYAVLAPRIEITPETRHLPRAYRGGGRLGREADLD